jgi:hypothetical protein
LIGFILPHSFLKKSLYFGSAILASLGGGGQETAISGRAIATAAIGIANTHAKTN